MSTGIASDADSISQGRVRVSHIFEEDLAWM